MFASQTPNAVSSNVASHALAALALPDLEYKSIHLPPADPAPLPRHARQSIVLTRREQQVLHWVAQGKKDWEIGAILFISSKTANYHVEGAKRKLKSATRMQAAILAIQLGLIAAPPAASVSGD